MVGSFKVDHTKLGRGIYLSKAQVVGNAEIITYDIRVRTPYKEPVMSDVCMHSVEHILANNLEDLFEKVPDLTRVYFGPMGCFAKGTKVVMADGTLKNVEDVEVGDYVMGDDSTPREVLSLTRGRDMMYKVHQSNNEDYVVNGRHKLCLEYNRSEVRYGCTKGDRIDVTVEEFLSQSGKFSDSFKGYKRGYELEEKEYEIPPYILGLWLGDGVRCKPELCVSSLHNFPFFFSRRSFRHPTLIA